MSWAAVAGAAVGVVGGAINSKKSSGSSGSTTTKTDVDPRLANYLYGQDDMGGLLADVAGWYQANKSGLNDQMAQGLNTQYGVYNDPGTMAGYQQMSSLGSGLMGTPMVGNPFAAGSASVADAGANLGMSPRAPQQGGQQVPQYQRYLPTAAPAPQASSAPFTSALQPYQQPPTPAAAPAPAPAPAATFEDYFNPIKTPTDARGWVWNGSMWTGERPEM